MIKICGRDIAV